MRAMPRPDTLPGPSLGDRLGYLAGIFGLAAAITAVWLGMRAVMAVSYTHLTLPTN